MSTPKVGDTSIQLQHRSIRVNRIRPRLDSALSVDFPWVLWTRWCYSFVHKKAESQQMPTLIKPASTHLCGIFFGGGVVSWSLAKLQEPLPIIRFLPGWCLQRWAHLLCAVHEKVWLKRSHTAHPPEVTCRDSSRSRPAPRAPAWALSPPRPRLHPAPSPWSSQLLIFHGRTPKRRQCPQDSAWACRSPACSPLPRCNA